MAIDRIGKGGGTQPPSGPTEVGGAGRAQETEGKRFEVRTERTASTAPVAPAASSALAQLRSGQIDMNRYLDLKVDEATGHLQGLSPKELASIKEMLRDQITSDPALADLVQQATGRAPTPREG
jgi:hypothetical protein